MMPGAEAPQQSCRGKQGSHTWLTFGLLDHMPAPCRLEEREVVLVVRFWAPLEMGS